MQRLTQKRNVFGSTSSLIVKAIEVRARTEGEGRAMGGRARAIAANGARMRREL